jgi:hypothetical protein
VVAFLAGLPFRFPYLHSRSTFRFVVRSQQTQFSLGVMHRFLILLVMGLAGCAGSERVSHRQPEHTHLWIDSPPQHIWSHEPVAGQGFIQRRLAAGDAVTLSGGVTISFDGSALRVRDTVLPANMLNCVVERDGTIHTNAFIRTFR